ncbi:MBL fold metallo-hydrolase [Paenibacillus sp. FSL R7-0302]|uniref:MBL fold metallo-hydrolase n=1 Tax=Paenibacillus sp. FSL R7-0302 TaxID=2921681 RepID=UPI0030FA1537
METPLKQIYQIRIPLPFRLNHVNSYLVQDGAWWSVIDPGLDTVITEKSWVQTLHQLHIKPSEIRNIYITHFHPDHYGFAGKMQRWAGAEVLASRETYALAEHYYSQEQGERNLQFYLKSGMPEVLAQEVAVLDSQLLQQISPITGTKVNLLEGDSITLAGEPYEIVLGGGHAEGSVGFWNAERQALIGGDLLLQTITPNITYQYEDDEDNPLASYFKTLHALQRRNIRTVLPGHGPVFQPQTGFFESVIAHHKERLNHVLDIVQEAGSAGLTIYDISLRLFSKVFDNDSARFALGETSAHVRYLERQKLLRVQESFGKYAVYKN